MKVQLVRKVSNDRPISSSAVAGQLEPSARILRTPMPHQSKALDYAYPKRKTAFFMEMRLGKSLVAVRWAFDKCEDYNARVLIVAPVSVLPVWEDELLDEGIERSKIHYLLGTKKQRLKISSPDQIDNGWFLVNYEGLRSCPELFEHFWRVVILDESTKIRSPKAAITKLCCDKLDYVPYKSILTGLPNPESSMDYFSQFKFLNGSFMGFDNFWKWRAHFFHQGYTAWQWVPNKGTLDLIKAEVHKLAFVMNRKQAKVGPKKVYEKRFVHMTNEQKRLYEDIDEKFAYDFKEYKIETKWAPVKHSWMLTLANGFLPRELIKVPTAIPNKFKIEELRPVTFISDVKFKELLNLLEGELKNDKVIVWFRFNHELEHSAKLLDNAGITYGKIRGSTPFEDRRRVCNDFQRASNPRVILAQFKCGKFGINSSVASTAIYFSNSFEMEDRAQSEDRIVHAKKEGSVLYIDLVTKDTVDEDLVETLRDKNTTAKLFQSSLISKWKERWQNRKVGKK